MPFYGGDSFHTLTASGQVGLVAVSLALSALTVWTAHRTMPGRRVLARIVIALGLFIAFVWLSPQVYYAYYRLLFDGLPAQIVIGSPPSPRTVTDILAFQHRATLSAHGLALLGWALLALVPFRR